MEEQNQLQKDKENPRRRPAGRLRLAVPAVLLLAFVVLGLLNGLNGAPQNTRPAKNPYTPEDFTTLDGYVTCTAGPTRRGLDVSKHQGPIDWEQVRSAGFDFAIIRIGYRGNTAGEIFPDSMARDNLAGAKAAGFDVGVYFYSQAISPEEAMEEAQWCLDFLAGEHLDLPLVYDWEYVSPSARTGAMDRKTLTECALTFCRTVEASGYQPMVYFNGHISRDLLDLKAIEGYPFWLAQYKDQMDYPYKVHFWQYTETGTVPGIDGNVDIDLMFLYE